MLVIQPGQHGSTFGGNPIAAKVAIAALEVVKEENLALNARVLGELFRSEMNRIVQSTDLLVKVRGKGLLNAVIVNDSETGKTAWNLCMRLMENGLLAKPTHGNIIRFAPPLVMTKDELLACVAIIEKTIREVKPEVVTKVPEVSEAQGKMEWMLNLLSSVSQEVREEPQKQQELRRMDMQLRAASRNLFEQERAFSRLLNQQIQNQEEMKAIKNQRDDLLRQMPSLVADAEASKKASFEIGNMEIELEKLRVQNRGLEAAKEEAQQMAVALAESSEVVVRSMQQTIQGQQQQTQQLQQETQGLRSRQEELTQSLAQAGQRSEALQQAIDASTAKISSLLDVIRDKEEEADNEQNAALQWEKVATERQTEVGELEAKLKTFEDKLASQQMVEQEREKVKAEIAQSRDLINKNTDVLTRSLERMKALRTKNKDRRKEIKDLRKQLDKRNVEFEALTKSSSMAPPPPRPPASASSTTTTTTTTTATSAATSSSSSVAAPVTAQRPFVQFSASAPVTPSTSAPGTPSASRKRKESAILPEELVAAVDDEDVSTALVKFSGSPEEKAIRDNIAMYITPQPKRQTTDVARPRSSFYSSSSSSSSSSNQPYVPPPMPQSAFTRPTAPYPLTSELLPVNLRDPSAKLPPVHNMPPLTRPVEAQGTARSGSDLVDAANVRRSADFLASLRQAENPLDLVQARFKSPLSGEAPKTPTEMDADELWGSPDAIARLDALGANLGARMQEEEKEDEAQDVAPEQVGAAQLSVSDVIREVRKYGAPGSDGKGKSRMRDPGKGLADDEIVEIMENDVPKRASKHFRGVFSFDELDKVTDLPLKEPSSFVINLDKSTGPGTHWVALYIDPRPGTRSIEYVDSFGDPPPKRVNDAITKMVKREFSHLPGLLQFKTNGVKLQSVTSPNCGFFAIDFIRKRSNGVPFQEATFFKKETRVAAGETAVKKAKHVFGYL
jgi:predicted  nucleic acid-binding Zn-ribbon protein